MAGGFMTGLATGFLNAKADQMKSDREAKVKLAATLAEESRASQRRLKDRLAASQQDYEQEIARNMESLKISREEAAKFALLPKKDRGDVVSRAHQRTKRQDNANAVVSNVAGPESDDFLTQVQKEVKASENIDLFAETQEERAAKLGYTYANAYDAIMAAAGSSFGAMYKDGVYQGMSSGLQHDSGKLKFAAEEAKRLAGQINDRVEKGKELFEDVMADLRLQAMDTAERYEAIRASRNRGEPQETTESTEATEDGGATKKGLRKPGEPGSKDAPLSVRTRADTIRSLENMAVGDWVLQNNGTRKKVTEQDIAALKALVGQNSRQRKPGAYPPAGRQ